MRRIMGAVVFGTVALGLVLAGAGVAEAGTITFTNSTVADGGTGFGNITNLLTLQEDTSEFGSVSWNGSAVVETGDATNSSDAPTYGTVVGDTGNTVIGIVFNINQQGNDTSVTLFDFTVNIHRASDGQIIDSFTYDAPEGGTTISLIQQGTGQAGWLFLLEGLGSYSTNDRFGMVITSDNAITNSNDGPDNFYVQSFPGNPVPLPPAALLGLGLMGGIGALRLRRRRKLAEL